MTRQTWPRPSPSMPIALRHPPLPVESRATSIQTQCGSREAICRSALWRYGLCQSFSPMSGLRRIAGENPDAVSLSRHTPSTTRQQDLALPRLYTGGRTRSAGRTPPDRRQGRGRIGIHDRTRADGACRRKGFHLDTLRGQGRGQRQRLRQQRVSVAGRHERRRKSVGDAFRHRDRRSESAICSVIAGAGVRPPRR